MALGLYSGLRNRETRIRERREKLADIEAANKEWQTRFDATNEASWQTWLKQNKITNEQNVQAATAAAEAQRIRDEAARAHDIELQALTQAYKVINDETEFQNFVRRSNVTFGLTEQSAVNAQGRLEAWDDKKHARDTASQIEIMVQRIGLETEAAKDRIKFELNRKAEINTQAAITAHANAMQQVLLERVMDGKVIGADFAAAVGGTTDPTAQIAQYSAAITALGVSKDNPVLAKLAGLNNPAVMKSTFETLQKYHTQIVESGQTGTTAIETFMEGANEYLGNLQITPADLTKPDQVIKQMETMLGKPLDSLTKSIIKSMPQSGSVIAVTEPTLVEPLDVSKLGDWVETITQDAVAQARNQQGKITKAKTTANEMAKTGSSEEKDLAGSLLDWLGKRDLAITEALDGVKNKDYYGVASLFGNQAIELAKAQEPRLENALIPDYLKQTSAEAPLVVLDPQVLRKLIEFKIITKGTLVTFKDKNGNERTERYSGE